jgi:hypothetical protein
MSGSPKHPTVLLWLRLSSHVIELEKCFRIGSFRAAEASFDVSGSACFLCARLPVWTNGRQSASVLTLKHTTGVEELWTSRATMRISTKATLTTISISYSTFSVKPFSGAELCSFGVAIIATLS